MAQETGVERLDYSKAPLAYDIGPDTGDNAGGWFWIHGPQGGGGHRGDIGATEAVVLADAWAHYKNRNDPPGCSIGLVMKGQGATTRGEFVVDWGTSQVAAVPAYKGKAQRAGAYQEARAAAWAWHDRRHALAARLEGEGVQLDVWPPALMWSDAECAECERWPGMRATPDDFPAVLRGLADAETLAAAGDACPGCDEDPEVGALSEEHQREQTATEALLKIGVASLPPGYKIYPGSWEEHMLRAAAAIAVAAVERPRCDTAAAIEQLQNELDAARALADAAMGDSRRSLDLAGVAFAERDKLQLEVERIGRVKAATPETVFEALRISDEENVRLRKVLADVRDDIEGTVSLDDVLARIAQVLE